MAGEGKALQEEVERELQKRSDATAFREGIASIESRIKAELDAAGKFTHDVNKTYANLVANYFGATAARLGKAPDELVQQYVACETGRGRGRFGGDFFVERVLGTERRTGCHCQIR